MGAKLAGPTIAGAAGAVGGCGLGGFRRPPGEPLVALAAQRSGFIIILFGGVEVGPVRFIVIARGTGRPALNTVPAAMV